MLLFYWDWRTSIKKLPCRSAQTIRRGCSTYNPCFCLTSGTTQAVVCETNHILLIVLLQVVELSLLDLEPTQVTMLTRMAVLVGAHGAALTNQVWMRPNMGAVVEIWHENYHYLNMAHMLGHRHISVTSDAAKVAAGVTEAMHDISARYTRNNFPAPVTDMKPARDAALSRD
eukprot:GHRR01028412.1.p1 GENE.GHRR01028412.1~~GHRR01028412.1.p1  ORF type:complete len:172 (+),score=21.43 GHRR01028412.1:100-615(+)